MVKLDLSKVIKEYLVEQHQEIVDGIVDLVAHHVQEPDAIKKGVLMGLVDWKVYSVIPLKVKETGEEIFYKITVKTESIENPEIEEAMREKQFRGPIEH